MVIFKLNHDTKFWKDSSWLSKYEHPRFSFVNALTATPSTLGRNQGCMLWRWVWSMYSDGVHLQPWDKMHPPCSLEFLHSLPLHSAWQSSDDHRGHWEHENPAACHPGRDDTASCHSVRFLHTRYGHVLVCSPTQPQTTRYFQDRSSSTRWAQWLQWTISTELKICIYGTMIHCRKSLPMYRLQTNLGKHSKFLKGLRSWYSLWPDCCDASGIAYSYSQEACCLGSKCCQMNGFVDLRTGDKQDQPQLNGNVKEFMPTDSTQEVIFPPLLQVLLASFHHALQETRNSNKQTWMSSHRCTRCLTMRTTWSLAMGLLPGIGQGT